MSYMPYTSNIPDPLHSIFIIGSSYSGVGLAHKLLKHGIPDSYEVVLVGPSSSLYWNVAAPRALSKDNVFGEGNIDLFREFVSSFADYAEQKKFRFIQGLATELRTHTSTVIIKQAHEQASEAQPLGIMEFPYDHLVFATGANYVDEWPFKSLGTRSETEKALQEKRLRIQAATHILISGAGPTGVETAGEIATYYPNKDITLVTSADTILHEVREDLRIAALKQLRALGVTVRTGVRVDSENFRNGKTIITLTNGERFETNLHIPAHGLVPNTRFVPKGMLDADGWVKVTQNLNVPNYSNVWAIGDVVADVQYRQLNNVGDMAQVVRDNIMLSITRYPGQTMTNFYEREPSFMIPIGNGFAKGVGLWGNWRQLGLFVWLIKGRNYMINDFEAIAEGQMLPAMKKV